jgi:hypothetical protein
MKKYIVLYLAPQTAQEKMAQASAKEMQEGMKPWMEWAQMLGEKLVDFGMPLGLGQKITKDGANPANTEVNGFSIIQAENMDEAKVLLKDHPHLSWVEGSAIEVYEFLPMPGMG